MNTEKPVITCCVTSCELPLDQKYWNNQWENQTTGWDIGYSSPAIVDFFEHFENKAAAILIPGCGNAYEAEYLLEKGFNNITLIDIAPKAVEILQEKFANNKGVQVICADFFMHKGKYDIIVEQTFLSALPPLMRPKYVWKMHELLKSNGKLIGLLFNKWFELDKPPFGGSQEEYTALFKGAFNWQDLAVSKKSIAQRLGNELFINFEKNEAVVVALYTFQGITCNGCMNTVCDKIAALPNVFNVQMSSDYSEILIVSEKAIALETLQALIAYDAKYSIVPFSK